MPRSSSYVLNPETGEWSLSTDSASTTDSNENLDSSLDGGNLTSSTSDKNSSTGSVEKEYNSIEINTLSGDLSFIATEETIKLRAGDTVKIVGIGKHLSGDYYVKDVTRQISSSGYTHSATLIRTDFGKSLKLNSTTIEKVEEKTVQSTPKSSTTERTYTVKKGDSLWKIAKQFYGDGAMYTKIYDSNSSKVVNPRLIYIGQVLVIP